MQKIEKELLKSIKGGYNEKMCAGIQYIANHYVENMNDEEWDNWMSEYDKYCV